MGRIAIDSILKYTDFNLFVVLRHDQRQFLKIPSNSRIRIHFLKKNPVSRHRADPFLLKFKALEACLRSMSENYVIMMDADTLVVREIDQEKIESALDGNGIGMVEQKTIQGSGMTRKDFLDHYLNHSLAWLSPDLTPPSLDKFRYFNSGVVLSHRLELTRIVSWAADRINRSKRDHQVGEHMIADQDYFQLWTNNLHPGSCTTLPWYWNHCSHWDRGFPRPGALILHFSNFCLGPGARQAIKSRFYRILLRLKEAALPVHLLG